MTMKDFNELPLLSGIYPFNTKRFSFDLICIKNDEFISCKFFGRDIMI